MIADISGYTMQNLDVKLFLNHASVSLVISKIISVVVIENVETCAIYIESEKCLQQMNLFTLRS